MFFFTSLQIKEDLLNSTTFEQKIRCIVDLFTVSCTQTVNKVEFSEVIQTHVKKVQLLEKYAPLQKLEKDVLVIEDSSELLSNDIAEVKNSLSEVRNMHLLLKKLC